MRMTFHRQISSIFYSPLIYSLLSVDLFNGEMKILSVYILKVCGIQPIVI